MTIVSLISSVRLSDITMRKFNVTTEVLDCHTHTQTVLLLQQLITTAIDNIDTLTTS